MDANIDEVFGRRSQHARRNAPAPAMSELALELMMMVSWGWMVPSAAARLARAQLLDYQRLGVDPLACISKIASAGAKGVCTGNVRWDFLSKFKPSKALPPTCNIRIPFLHTKGPGSRLPNFMTLPILLPNELFDYLYRNFRSYFDRVLGSGLENFWNSVRNLV